MIVEGMSDTIKHRTSNHSSQNSSTDSKSEMAEWDYLLPPGGNKLHGKMHQQLLRRRKRSTWWKQMRAALRRNISIKLKQKRRTFIEVFAPLYIFVLLALVRTIVPAVHVPAVMEPPGVASITTSVDATTPLAVMVTPDGPAHQRFAERLHSTLFSMGYNCKVGTVPSEWVMEEYARQGVGTPALGVVLSADPHSQYTYTLRPDQRMMGPIGLGATGDQCHAGIGSPIETPFSCPGNQFFYSGFLTVQNAIDSVFLSMIADAHIPPTNISILNGPKHESDAISATFLRVFIPLYMVISLSQFITYQLILVVGEKEAKIKDGLKLMGLRDSVYWTAWFAVYGCYIVFVAAACSLILYYSHVFSSSNMFIIFVFYVLYGWSLIMLGFMITPFFSKAKVAGGVGSLMVTIVSLFYLFQVYIKSLPKSFFWVLSLMSPVAFTLGIDRAVELDASNMGVTMSTLWFADTGVPFADTMIMMVVDIVLYAFLAFYLDNVIPTEFGRRESIFFLFQKSYWTRYRQPGLLSDSEATFTSADELAQNNIEPVPAELRKRAALRVYGLRKEFDSGNEHVVAVDDISLDMYEGQITAILGHNGAGKTTFFNVLTGLTRPTAGAASMYGLDITDAGDMREIWSMMGICPQHDILVQELTPRDHLRFIGAIRNIADDQLMAEVERTLADVDLLDKADQPVAILSGGQKRKLSIGQALIGDPKVVILDEPTAGVDPYSRRHMWELLSRRKHGRLVLLTTHFMDEADILADRKAVISSGKLRCCGSSMYLKNKFGLGYHLTIVMGATSVVELIDEVVGTLVPGREIGRRHGNELAFILPMESVTNFPELFNLLEEQQTSLDILSFGLSLTSLEEVFLQLAEQDLAEDGTLSDLTRDLLRRRLCVTEVDSSGEPAQQPQQSSHVHRSLAMASSPPEVPIRPGSWQAIRALLKIRYLNFIRVPANVIFTLVLPMFMMFLGLYVNNSGGQRTPPQNITMLISSALYTNYDSVLLHNATGGSLDLFLSGLGLRATPFDGAYTGLINYTSVLAALNVSHIYRPPPQPAVSTTGNATPSLSALPSQITAVMNDQVNYVAPILVNAINNALLKEITGLDGPSPIVVMSRSLPAVSSDMDFDIGVFTSSFLVGFLFLLFPCNIALELVMERQMRIRNQLRVNGVTFTAYYMSFLMFNLPLFLAMWASMLVMVRLMGVLALSQGPALTMLAAVYFEYCFVGLLFASVCAHLFDRLDTAQAIYPNVANVCGMMSYMLVAMLDMAQMGNQLGVRLHYLFALFNPFYMPCGSLYFISKTYLLTTTMGGRQLEYADFWQNPVYVVPLVAQPVQVLLCWKLLHVLDRVKSRGVQFSVTGVVLGMFVRLRKFAVKKLGLSAFDCEASSRPAEDVDVTSERARVAAIVKQLPSPTPPVVIATELVKKYKCPGRGPLLAVDNISLAVDAGEVFGLLGPNGAGKTSTMKIMIAEEQADSGQILVNGLPLHSAQSNAFQEIGYCPQFDTLWRYITVEEHIDCWAQVRGIAPKDVWKIIDYYLDGLWIREHAAKRTGKCSGGTKRKLSYALSMLGRPRIVLLDEPSTGMDPQSKRFLWDTISAAFRGERGAVLTTHSMEEADALCTRLAIMVHGRMRCLGSTQHLKNKYGAGYTLEMKLVAGDGLLERSQEVELVIRNLFPSALVEENYGEMVRYKIPQEEITSLARAFSELESAKHRVGIEEYNLSQTTLEQVFLRFAKEQELGETEQ